MRWFVLAFTRMTDKESSADGYSPDERESLLKTPTVFSPQARKRATASSVSD